MYVHDGGMMRGQRTCATREDWRQQAMAVAAIMHGGDFACCTQVRVEAAGVMQALDV